MKINRASLEASAHRLDTPLRNGHRFGSPCQENISGQHETLPEDWAQVVTSEVLSIVCVDSVDNRPELDSWLPRSAKPNRRAAMPEDTIQLATGPDREFGSSGERRVALEGTIDFSHQIH